MHENSLFHFGSYDSHCIIGKVKYTEADMLKNSWGRGVKSLEGDGLTCGRSHCTPAAARPSARAGGNSGSSHSAPPAAPPTPPAAELLLGEGVHIVLS